MAQENIFRMNATLAEPSPLASSALLTKEIVNNFCRACLSQAPQSYGEKIHWKLEDKVNDQNITFLQLYNKLLLDIEVHIDDNLPQNLCDKCAEELIWFHGLRNRCIKSESILCSLVSKEVNMNTEGRDVPQIITSLKKSDVNQDVNSILDRNTPVSEIVDVNRINEPKEELECSSVKNDVFTVERDAIKHEENKNIVQLVSQAAHESAEIEDDSSVTSDNSTTDLESKLMNSPELTKPASQPSKCKESKCKTKTKRIKRTYPNIHKCNMCNKAFKFLSRLQCHMRKHTKEKPYSCPICPARFSTRRNLPRHIRTHTGEKPHACETCGKAFIQKNNLDTHRRMHTGEKPIVCSLCGRCFSTVTGYKYHIMKYHSTKTDNVSTKVDDHFDGSHFNCGICGRSFRIRGYYEKHLLKHEGKNLSEERNFLCTICGKAWASYSSLRQHNIQVHTKEFPFCCDYCGKTFVYNSDLKMHIRIHTGERPYRCEHCEKTFVKSELLKNHTLLHTGEKPHVCEICSKRFTQGSHLMYHMRSHNGVKPYSCNLCPRKFASRAALTVHVRTHTGETPYACTICSKKFYCERTWKKHEKRHESSKQ